MVFSPIATRAVLLPLDLSLTVPQTGAIADYCRFYQLDFESYLPNIHHACGWHHAAGYQILTHVFRPINARGTVFIVHGYLEHSGLYRHVVPVMLKAGYAVVIYDLPGHGLSSGVRASIRDFAEYQTILASVLSTLSAQLPTPYLGLGQSTGAAILMDYALSAKQSPYFDRLCLLAPLVYPARMQALQMQFAFWWFSATRSGLPRAFRKNTQDTNFLRFMRDEDPLQARWIPVSWLIALKHWIKHIHLQSPSRLPVWLVQGGQDRTVNGTYNTQFIQQHFNVQHFLWLPEAGHQLANEQTAIRQRVLDILAEFLQSPQ
ncbi:alpha/beta hydrolase [Agitococcus lubricus]|uniref:Lysophospholipase n=1 Tax=Agitococcus lubricus TaxID=1077255 RepID=A0A2T5J298_9GAMM|nr:alpha/beta hydrolase [Agitococcus lubricus]PTQ90640.1 lysophospholipase [Agitococcus lubricus]